jgi:nucleoside-diphosphate-sugar epimerase
MAKFLITGGAGFIGSNIARKVVSDGGEVVILDDFSAGY